MHGTVHKALKTYIAERTDEVSWETVRSQSGVESALYLPVSYYPDEDVTMILETLATHSGHDVATLERGFGNAVAPELLQTFKAHVRGEWELFDLFANIEQICAKLDSSAEEMSPPAISSTREDEQTVIVTYRSERGHEAMAHGVLEGLIDAFDTEATVTSVDDDPGDGCSFRVELAESE